MSLSFPCPQCTKTLKAPTSLAGKRARCPHCRQAVAIPQPAAPAPPSRLEEPLSLDSLASLDSLMQDDPWTRSDLSAPTFGASPAQRQASYIAPRVTPTAGIRYWLFGLALVPLAWVLLSPPPDREDLQRALEEPASTSEEPSGDQVADEASSSDEPAWDGDVSEMDLDDLAGLFPDNRLPGAHLARDSWRHWLYAFLAAVLFFGLILSLFQQGLAERWHLLGVGLLTATCGVMSLLMFQWFATAGSLLSFAGILGIFSLIIRLIGFSYAAALNPDNGFVISLVGFTFGVGLCEEFIKAIPILSRFRNEYAMDWRGACVWGLASGVGFGVAEGIIYSSDYYNGVAGVEMYVVRFVSCVALHAIWTASVGILLWHHQDAVRGDMEWGDWAIAILKIQGVAMLLHGLYDTLLKRDMTFLALLTALASFGFLVWLIQWTLQTDAPPRRQPAA